jgi:5-methylcytosine-specific restriction endonuclease McrA
MEQTLLLNATFEPLKVVDWQRAMTLWARGKVEIVATHDREVRSVSFAFRLPAVVRLLRFVRVRRALEFVPFTRSNIYTRDGYSCQYCGGQFASDELTFDHVVPASQGGLRSWENIVTCCMDCNRRKGGRTPAEAGMALRRAPSRPAALPVFRLTIGVRNMPPSWRDFLYWHVELE